MEPRRAVTLRADAPGQEFKVVAKSIPDRELSDAPSRGERRAEAKRIRASLAHFLSWWREYFDLQPRLEALPDARKQGRAKIPQPAVLFAILLMYWLGFGSVKALDDRLRHSATLRRLLAQYGWSGGISDDTFADVLDGMDMEALRQVLYAIGKRALKRWATGPYRDSVLGTRLAGVGCAGLVARPLVAIDGHELFVTHSDKRTCSDCRVRKIKQKAPDGTETVVEQHYHTIVVAQWVGVHPAVILDFEPIHPGEGEQIAAYRIVSRLEEVYGRAIGILVADAAYDGEPFRKATRKAGYHYVIRHKNANIDPGKALKRAVDKRDLERTAPDRRYNETASRRRYECWDEEDPILGLRYIEARRTTRAVRSDKENFHKGACITDLPREQAPAVAVAMMMETRWSIESAFHELVGEWSVDRAFVHTGRPTAVLAIACLAFMAYNALATYMYRSLGINPRRPERTFGNIRDDLWETLTEVGKKARAHPS